MKPADRFIFFFKNLSGKSRRELAAIGIILCVSVALSLPAYFSDMALQKEQISRARPNDIAVSSPELQGMDGKLLEEAGRSLSKTSIMSFIVLRHGCIVHEQYYDDIDPGAYYNVFSVTKSFISALTGIAIREGDIKSTQDRLVGYFPDHFAMTADNRWKDITIEHLLTMTPGFVEDLAAWSGSQDWLESTFSLPLVFNPGEKFQYANSASHLLSVIITKASGLSTYDFAEKHLFTPMNIKNKVWSPDPSGYQTGYANLFLTPRDMVKFGYLYLNKGKWQGRQLIPEEWVRESTSVKYDFNEKSNEEKDAGHIDGYGYKWWINGETGYYMYSALGYGGQSIDVIPELDLVVVMTAQPDSPVPLEERIRIAALKEYVIPSVTQFQQIAKESQ